MKRKDGLPLLKAQMGLHDDIKITLDDFREDARTFFLHEHSMDAKRATQSAKKLMNLSRRLWEITRRT